MVEEQIEDLDVQMRDLDDFVSRAKSHNASHHEQHGESMRDVDATVEQSFSSISGHFRETFERVQRLGEEVDVDTNRLQDGLDPLDEDVRQPLAELREDVQRTEMREYEPTGDTPEKVQYHFPTDLPRTGSHDALLAAMRESPTPCKPSVALLPNINLTPAAKSPSPARTRSPVARSPARATAASSPIRHADSQNNRLSMSLREVNPNVTATAPPPPPPPGSLVFDPSSSLALPPPGSDGGNHVGANANSNSSSSSSSGDNGSEEVPMLKPNVRTRSSRLSKKVYGGVGVADGPENVPPAALRSSGRRKSPRLH